MVLQNIHIFNQKVQTGSKCKTDPGNEVSPFIMQ